MHALIDWLLTTIGALGYPGIFALMAMESSIIPIPSELVMPPAGYLAHQGEMNMLVAILCGTLGSLVGAYANYFAAHYLGRPLILKYGKYVWITEEKFAKVETFFHKHGEISTFIGQASPGGAPSHFAPGRAGRDEPCEIHPLYPAWRRNLGDGTDLDRLVYRQGAGADHEVFPPGGDWGGDLQRRADSGLCMAA